tara:strand:+ start:2486 stop:3112 length:627 start_codon:yes stop_codon:yes gene_type:complete
MCAVIGAFLQKPDDKDLHVLKEIFLQSKIRGLHATGLSFVKNRKVHTKKEPLPADIFLKDIDLNECVNEDKNIYLIGHCRYSTSDLFYNQPIQTSDDLAVVHNGVITQEDPQDWIYKAETKNDTELINLAIKDNKNPIELYKDSSISALELHSNKKIVFYRNGKRPMYKTKYKKGFFITSTKDIPMRVSPSLLAKKVKMSGDKVDLQH